MSADTPTLSEFSNIHSPKRVVLLNELSLHAEQSFHDFAEDSSCRILFVQMHSNFVNSVHERLH
jgi:hypothetical protein